MTATLSAARFVEPSGKPSVAPPCMAGLRRWLLVLLALMGGAAQAQTLVPIHDILRTDGPDPMPDSPYLYAHYGAEVAVSGVVVGIMSTGGFYLTPPSSQWDTDYDSAEGLPIFYAAGQLPSCAVVGNLVTVTGKVVNSAAENGALTPGTGIEPSSCTVTGTGGYISGGAPLSPPQTDTFGGLLAYTGVPIYNVSFYAVSPSGENGLTTGQFWASFEPQSATPLLRAPGIAGDEFVPAGTAATVPRWSGNPQRVLVDRSTFGGPAINIATGQTLNCGLANLIAIGVGLVDYSLGYARILLFPSVGCSVVGTAPTPVSATANTANSFQVGTLNVGSLSSTSTDYATRLAKAALAVTTVQASPSLVSLEGIGDAAALSGLASAASSGGARYAAEYLPPNEPSQGGPGFLVDTTQAAVVSLTQAGAGETYTDPASGNAATLWERPPLVLKINIHRAGAGYPLTVVGVHLTPRLGLDQPTGGATIRAHRAAQAAMLSSLIQTHQSAGENVVVAGDFDASEFNDGFVDVLGVVTGAPADASQVVLYQGTSTTSPLTNLTTQIPAGQRYDMIENGNAAATEHILVSTQVNARTAVEPLSGLVSSVTQPRFTTDFSGDRSADATTPVALGAHDGEVMRFTIPDVPTQLTASPDPLNLGSVEKGSSSTGQITLTNAMGAAATITVSSIGISGTHAADFSETNNCSRLAENATCAIRVQFQASVAGTETAQINVASDAQLDASLVIPMTATVVGSSASLTPTGATFASAAPGSTTGPVSFTYTNTSTLTTETVSAVSVSGPFALTGNACGGSVAPGGSCVLAVSFTPTASGAQTGTLTVTDSSTDNPTLTASLGGTGLSTATVSASSLNFGTVTVSAVSAAQTVIWTNTSTVPQSISAVTILGDYAIGSNSCTGVLQAGKSCAVAVTFAPTATGARTGTLQIASTATGDPVLNVSLAGVGVASTATLTPGSATFPNTAEGASSATQRFTWTNTSLIPLTVSSVQVTGGFAIRTGTCAGSMGPGASCTMDVAFVPVAAGIAHGTLTVNSTSLANPTLTAALTGGDKDFSVSLNPTSGSLIAGFIAQETTLTITPTVGSGDAIQIACTTNAPDSTCTPGTTATTLTAAIAVPVTIGTISKNTVIGYGGFAQTRLLWLLGGATAGLLAMRRKTRLGVRAMLWLLLMAGSGLLGLGCGSGTAPNGAYTTAGSYTYRMVVTDGVNSHEADFTLTVTSH